MMEAIWTFLTAPENRETLTWLGRGAVAVGAVLGTAITFFARKDGPGGGGAEADPQDILAEKGGRAAGRAINENSGNTTRISSGISGWHLVAIAVVLSGLALLAIAQVGNRVTADSGSVGVGGDVQGTDIKVGQ